MWRHLRSLATGRESGARFLIARWVFLRLLGAVYLIAFVSFWVQADGLVGSHGILPVADYFNAVHRSLGNEAYRECPTFLWIDASDKAIHLLCLAGTALSVLLLAGFAQVVVLPLLWACYLSVVIAGQTFLSFQWDCLLLEVGFLSIFLAPLRLLPGLAADSTTPPLTQWLFRWTLARFMFLSGIVKLLWNDPVWWNQTALSFHYETTCLPTWLGWWAFQLPPFVQNVSCICMFVIELFVPFLCFGPRRCRAVAFVCLAGLQVMIAATGNYTFFNLLTFALCVLLLDDEQWPGWVRRRVVASVEPRRAWPWFVLLPIALGILFFSGIATWDGLKGRKRMRSRDEFWRAEWVQKTIDAVEPFRTFNSYGLFRTMTRPRYEIEVQGSEDGWDWKAYEFKWKPGDVNRRPAFVAPHQPRLDWQMWFEALPPWRGTVWFDNFLFRLLEGRPEVLALLDSNPFPIRPPKYVRVVFYEYHFTDLAERRATGAWWKRTELGGSEPISLPQR